MTFSEIDLLNVADIEKYCNDLKAKCNFGAISNNLTLNKNTELIKIREIQNEISESAEKISNILQSMPLLSKDYEFIKFVGYEETFQKIKEHFPKTSEAEKRQTPNALLKALPIIKPKVLINLIPYFTNLNSLNNRLGEIGKELEAILKNFHFTDEEKNE